jgi:hypothetical protein
MPVFPKIFQWRKPLKQFFIFPGLATYDNVYRPPAPEKNKHFDVSLLWPLAGQKMLFYVEGYLDLTRHSNLFIYSTISRERRNNRMHKPGWETLAF